MYSRNTFSLLCNINRKRYLTLINQSRNVKLQPSVAVDSEQNSETYEQKNTRLNRPLSPHLTIYKPQLTSMLSITHRITGIALIGYAGIIAASGHLYDVENLVEYIKSLHLSPTTLFISKTIIAAPVSYHIVNGIRHLFWDAGFGFSIKTVYITGYAVLAATVILSMVLATI